jgi:hypothetical protein
MRSSFAGLTALAVVALAVPAAVAKVAPPTHVAERVARTDAVVVGKVTSIDKGTVKVRDNDYAVAIVQVEDGISGVKGLTHVRVAFFPGENLRFPWLSLKVGQEACFFLTRDARGTVFLVNAYYDLIPKEQANFKDDVATAKKCARLLQDVDASLKAADAETRALTAAMLLTRYRYPTQSGRQEDIDAAQSKLILLALADADWSVQDYRAPVNPTILFNRLPDKEKFGWKPPAALGQFPAAAKAWLKDNAEKYRVQRFVN